MERSSLETLFRALDRAAIVPGLEVSFVAFDDLLAMKRGAGRPQDLADIDRLERIRRNRRGDA